MPEPVRPPASKRVATPAAAAEKTTAADRRRFPVGIDLGTTFSSLAYVDESGRVDSLRLPGSGFALASAVYFKSDSEIIVGNEALNFALIDPSRVARAFKRQMGDPDWKFEVGDRKYRPEELSAMVLKKLLDAAGEQIGPIDSAVISVPFVFDEVRRRATQDAGRIAGLKQIDIVDEPVAAAMAYGNALLQAKGSGFYGDAELDEVFGDQVILVYDLGGGTFDLTIMRFRSDYTFDVLATGGDWQLGGEDWDKLLAQFLTEELHARSGAPVEDSELQQEIRTKAEETKRSLSERPRCAVRLLHHGQDLTIELDRGTFERISASLLGRTQATIEEVLEQKQVAWNQIDRVLMIGGSSRMPMVLKMLQRIANRPLDMSLSPDTAVAKGAALYAAQRAGHESMKQIKIKTVNSHALGLVAKDPKTNARINHVLIPSNEDTLKKATYTYRISPGKDIGLIVLEGDLPNPSDCVELGRQRITLPQNIASGKLAIEFSFQENGLLRVEGIVNAPGQQPIRSKFEIPVNGKMTEREVQAATASLQGISIE